MKRPLHMSNFIILLGLLLFSCSKATEPKDALDTPIFNPPGGTYYLGQVVQILCDIEEADIYYTVDGTNPTENSIRYEDPLQLNESTTLKARAFKHGWHASEVATADYDIADSPDYAWCLIPSGEFTYGQDNAISNIPYDYEIMKYDVTNSQYLAYLQEAYAVGEIYIFGDEVRGYYPGGNSIEPGNYRLYILGTDLGNNCARISYQDNEFIMNYPNAFSEEDFLNHPVVFVTWFGAWHFTNYYGWRLPTDEEWEKAARGITSYNYPWGNTIDSSRANFRDSGDPFDNGTTPVGFYNGSIHNGFSTVDSPSPFGLYDMAGNVRNWTNSLIEFGSSDFIVRGGSWAVYSTYYLQSWHQHQAPPSLYTNSYGFRCVRSIN